MTTPINEDPYLYRKNLHKNLSGHIKINLTDSATTDLKFRLHVDLLTKDDIVGRSN